MKSPEIETIENALKYLVESNKFKYSDLGFASSLLTRLVSQPLSRAQIEAAHKMLYKYKNSLTETGVILPTKPELDRAIASGLGISTSKKKIRTISLQSDVVVVSFDYDAEMVEAIKKFKTFRYEPSNKTWITKLSNLIIAIDLLEPYGFVLDVAAKTAYMAAKSRSNELESWATAYLEHDAINWVRQPYNHQWQAVRFVLSQDNLRCLIADSMGVGKSYEAAIAAKGIREYFYSQCNETVKILIVCPVSLKDNWVREMEMVNIPRDAYEIHSHGKIPSTPVFKFILICDEFHFAQSMQSQRTKNILDLAASTECLSLIGLTGTPMRNGRPSNLFPLLRAVQHPIAVNRQQYETRYCDAGIKFSRWDITGASNLEELSEIVKSKVIRRTKDEVLDLPDKTFIDVYCNDAPKEVKDAYKAALDQLKIDYQSKVETGVRKSISSPVVMLAKMRSLSSEYKIYKARELADQILAENNQIVIFTHFVNTAKKLADIYDVIPYTGETKPCDRQPIVDNFQAGKSKVFVGTIGAGGVGITLTKSSYLIMVDLPWTPGDYQQATDRIHRIGQTNPCTIYDIYATDVDYIVSATINKKSAIIDKVLGKYKINDITDHVDIVNKLLA